MAFYESDSVSNGGDMVPDKHSCRQCDDGIVTYVWAGECCESDCSAYSNSCAVCDSCEYSHHAQYEEQPIRGICNKCTDTSVRAISGKQFDVNVKDYYYATHGLCEACFEDAQRNEKKLHELKELSKNRPTAMAKLHALFQERCKTLPQNLKPIKQMYEMDDVPHPLMWRTPAELTDLDIQKHQNRWKFCRNRAQCFVDLGMLTYWCFPSIYAITGRYDTRR